MYVSCHAPSFVDNAVSLCRPRSGNFGGTPFAPSRAWPVDLFPHTERCELVVLLERGGGGGRAAGGDGAVAEASSSVSGREAADAEALAMEPPRAPVDEGCA